MKNIQNELVSADMLGQDARKQLGFNEEWFAKMKILKSAIVKTSKEILNKKGRITVDIVYEKIKETGVSIFLGTELYQKNVIKNILNDVVEPKNQFNPIVPNHNASEVFEYKPKPLMKIIPQDLND
jgi:hypothetical protein